MGQGDVLKVLKENKWMCSGEIGSILHQDRNNINFLLRKLFKQDEVEKKITPRIGGGRLTEWKLKEKQD